MKKQILMGLLALTISLSAKDCKIITSTLDNNDITIGGANWRGETNPIINTKNNYKFTSFLDAYSSFDTDIRNYIKTNTCKKNGWDGVQNYKITWEIKKDYYAFIATYDYFAFK